MAGDLTTEFQTVLWSFLRDKIGIPWSTDFIGLGRIQDGKLIAVVGYNNFTGTSCYMHMAGDHKRWVTKEFIREAFRYPFETLGLDMVFGVVPSGNIQALKMDRKLGFEEIVYIPGAHPDGGIHLLQMKREDCRWLRDKDGKEKHTEAA